MPTVIELIQKRNQLITQAREIVDLAEKAGRVKLEPEEEQRWDKLFAEAQEIQKALARDEKLRAIEAAVAKPPGERDQADAGQKEMRAAWCKVLRGEEGGEREYRALQQDVATQAGYLVAPQDFQAQLIADLDNEVFLRGLAQKFTLTKAVSMGFPKRTARASTYAPGTEIGAPTADSTLAFGKREFIPRPVTGEILVSKTLLRNAALSVDEIVRKELAYNRAIYEEQDLMTGSGAAGHVLGLFTASADGISTARDVSTGNTTTSMTFDGLYEAKFKIKNRSRRKLGWVFHSDGVKQLAKLKDGESRNIWQPSVVANVPDTLLGYPVYESEYAPNTFTTGLYVGILGDFYSGLWIVDSLSMELQVLYELYARTNQVDFIDRFEWDAMPVLEEAFARVTLA